MTRHIKLGKQPSKLSKDLTLLQNEKCLITVRGGTLALPILVEGNPRGYFFIGMGQFILDAIIDTPKGAIGKSLFADLNRPFLMFSADNTIVEDLVPASDQDVSNIGNANLEDFLLKANDVFAHITMVHNKYLKVEKGTQMFAFFSPDKTWDILLAKEDKLIFTSRNKVYIFKDLVGDTKSNPQHIHFAENGKTVIIEKNNILIDFDVEHRPF